MGRWNWLRQRTVVALVAALAMALPLVSLGSSSALAADGPQISIQSGSIPGTLMVDGDGWSGSAGVSLYQCADQVDSEEALWQLCDMSTGVQVTVDPPWTTDFQTKGVLSLSQPFPPRSENAWGNGTYDCEAVDATCTIVATEDWQTFVWTNPDYTALYGPLDKATVTDDTTGLTDGAPVGVHNTGHRPGTQAMAYVCAGYGYAFPGGCDPIPGSERTIDSDGAYDAAVSLPRWVWVNDPFGNASWYDGANGVSVLVVSAGNLASPYWEAGADSLITFRNEPFEKNPQLFTVTQVRVNKSGGITVEGKINCSQAVMEWGQQNAMAAVHNDWTARQPVGRKGVVTAHYSAAIMQSCHEPGKTGPYTWATHPPITSSAIWWVYPDSGGKFVAGKIHIDAQATGGSFSSSPGADQYLITGATQWDGRAVTK